MLVPSKPSERYRANRYIAGPGLLQSQRDIGFRHAENRHLAKGVVFDQEVEMVSMGSLFRASSRFRSRACPATAAVGDSAPRTAGSPPGRESPATRCPKLDAGGQHIFTNVRARGGIFQALDELRVAAVVRPGRNKGRKTVEPGWIRIGIGADFDAGPSRCVDVRDNLRHAPPVGVSGRFQVPDLDRECAPRGRCVWPRRAPE